MMTKFNKYRLFIILFIALVSIYVSQAMPLFYGLNRRTFAGQLLFFMVSSITFFFFDIMLNNKGKLIFYVAWGFILPSWFVCDFWGITFLFWIPALFYTMYFFYLSTTIFKRSTIVKQE